MPKIEFLPSGTTVQVDSGTELAKAFRRAGIEIETPCGGEGTCGKCRVKILSGAVEENAGGVLPEDAVLEGYVLACQSRVADTDLVVEVPDLGQKGGQFAEAASIAEHHIAQASAPPVRELLLSVQQPKLEDGLSDLDRIALALKPEFGEERIEFPLPVLRTAAASLRRHNGQIRAVLSCGTETPRIIRIEPGHTPEPLLGVAIDIGTTTIAVQLMELSSGRDLETRTDYNEQIPCGLDVISRINYAQRPGHLEELRARVLRTINTLIARVCDGRGFDAKKVCAASMSGNTVMMHLALGLDPQHIRLEPYTPTVYRFPDLRCGAAGVEIEPEAPLYISPCVGSYVGGDITAGLLCTDLARNKDDTSLFIDIGTNGEMVIGNKDFLMCCACSAGPAFEGGGIECGMRASQGAIDKVTVDAASGRPTIRTIGNAAPMGICGSGIIDLLANLLRTGWMDQAGKFQRGRSSPSVFVEGRKAYYVLAEAEQSGTGKRIAISETDVENVIRAKAAIYAACSLLLERVGLSVADLHNVFIGGGFGRFLDLEKAILIGLLPELPLERFHYIGNSSLTGSALCLVSEYHRNKQNELAARMSYFELNTDPAYMHQYTGALFLPHTDDARFPVTTKSLQNSRSGGIHA